MEKHLLFTATSGDRFFCRVVGVLIAHNSLTLHPSPAPSPHEYLTSQFPHSVHATTKVWALGGSCEHLMSAQCG